jgi:hypothetical protein
MRAPGIGLPVVAACSIADEKKGNFCLVTLRRTAFRCSAGSGGPSGDRRIDRGVGRLPAAAFPDAGGAGTARKGGSASLAGLKLALSPPSRQVFNGNDALLTITWGHPSPSISPCSRSPGPSEFSRGRP